MSEWIQRAKIIIPKMIGRFPRNTNWISRKLIMLHGFDKTSGTIYKVLRDLVTSGVLFRVIYMGKNIWFTEKAIICGPAFRTLLKKYKDEHNT